MNYKEKQKKLLEKQRQDREQLIREEEIYNLLPSEIEPKLVMGHGYKADGTIVYSNVQWENVQYYMNLFHVRRLFYVKGTFTSYLHFDAFDHNDASIEICEIAPWTIRFHTWGDKHNYQGLEVKFYASLINGQTIQVQLELDNYHDYIGRYWQGPRNKNGGWALRTSFTLDTLRWGTGTPGNIDQSFHSWDKSIDFADIQIGEEFSQQYDHRR